MDIDIFSDTICPWCFIGKRRLERALAERPQPDLTIHWRAFQLNPDMPAGGMDRSQYLEQKFGGASNAEAIYDQVRAAGETEGIDFAFERMKRTPNTIDSHRLIRHAGQQAQQGQARQDAVVQALFDAYFLRAEDIGDPGGLAPAAAEAGLDTDETAPVLAASKSVSCLGLPTMVEAAVFEFLDRGYYDAHLKQLQHELDSRYQNCLNILRQTMPDSVKWTTPGGGPFKRRSAVNLAGRANRIRALCSSRRTS